MSRFFFPPQKTADNVVGGVTSTVDAVTSAPRKVKESVWETQKSQKGGVKNDVIIGCYPWCVKFGGTFFFGEGGGLASYDDVFFF